MIWRVAFILLLSLCTLWMHFGPGPNGPDFVPVAPTFEGGWR